MFVRIVERRSYFEYQTGEGERGREDYHPWNLCETLDRIFFDLKVTRYEILWNDGAVAQGCIGRGPVFS